MNKEENKRFALESDQNDLLANFRNQYHIPLHNGKPCIYLCGNSLGLQPKTVREHIEKELLHWEKYGVEGHFMGDDPWVSYHESFSPLLAPLIGAKEIEVVAMNQLTVNLHLMMVSFYRPTTKKYKILMEASAFPSDQYAVESQVKFHGFDENAIIEVKPNNGVLISTESICNSILENKDELALVLLSGVNYYTGQVFDIETIAKLCKEHDILIGVDLAHAIGNIPMQLHNWDIDFATWCSYKYLNSGPGGVSGIFIHEKYAQDKTLPRFAGWWGHDAASRFKMQKGFIPQAGAEGWQLSNAPVLSMAAHKAALILFQQAGLKNLRAKSLALTDFCIQLLNEINEEKKEVLFQIITPLNKNERGSQLSIVAMHNGRKIFEELSKRGVICDWREPDVIRIAPVPMYNTFEDVYNFINILKEIIE